MNKSIEKKSRYRFMASRVGAAGMAVAAALTLAACDGKGGGYIGAPIPQTTNPVFNGRADFGFTFDCSDGVKGEITYHDRSTKVGVAPFPYPGLRLHGTVTNVLVDTNPLDTIPAKPAVTCDDLRDEPWAQFQGKYRSQETDTVFEEETGTFTVVVFDQGEPGRSIIVEDENGVDASITGDGFSIRLAGGPYPVYDRSGYIENGNIQVNNNNN